jgi:two-component system LytT family response regulator
MEALISRHTITSVGKNKVVNHPGSLRHAHTPLHIISNSRKLIVPLINGFECYRFEQMQFLKAQGNYTELYTGNKKILISKTLKSMESQLPGSLFFRVHKSYLVNLSYIKAYVNSSDNPHLVLEDDTCIPVSRYKKSQFRLKQGVM